MDRDTSDHSALPAFPSATTPPRSPVTSRPLHFAPSTASLANRSVHIEMDPEHQTPKANAPQSDSSFENEKAQLEAETETGTATLSIDPRTMNRRSYAGVGAGGGLGPLPALPPDARPVPRRQRTLDTHRSGLDYVIPVTRIPKNITFRLADTIKDAENEKKKYEQKARMIGYSLNLALGLQVLLGAMITALSAVTSGRQTSIMTAILGGLTTCVTSYLAKTRGSKEPELSITRVKDLEHFLRDCKSFQTDFGDHEGTDYDQQLGNLRKRFEDLLGNGSGERRLDLA